MVSDVLLIPGLVLGAGVALAAVVALALRRPALRGALARAADTPLQQALGLAAVVGVLAVGASLAKLFDLPLGTAGLVLAGPALFAYAHLELAAAVAGFRASACRGTGARDASRPSGTSSGGSRGGRPTSPSATSPCRSPSSASWCSPSPRRSWCWARWSPATTCWAWAGPSPSRPSRSPSAPATAGDTSCPTARRRTWRRRSQSDAENPSRPTRTSPS